MADNRALSSVCAVVNVVTQTVASVSLDHQALVQEASIYCFLQEVMECRYRAMEKAPMLFRLMMVIAKLVVSHCWSVLLLYDVHVHNKKGCSRQLYVFLLMKTEQ